MYSRNWFFGVALISPFLYTAKIILSPAYILPLVLVVIYLFGFKPLSWAYVIVGMLGLSLCIFHAAIHELHAAAVHGMIFSLFAVVYPYFLDARNHASITQGAKAGYKIICIYFIIELLIRFAIPERFVPDASEFAYHLESENTWFYAYKYGSFAFVDSNLTGLALLMLECVGISLYSARKIKSTLLILNIFMVLMTFSRAAWIGQFVILFSFVFYRYKYFLYFSIVAAPLFYFGNLIEFDDASFLTKIALYINLIEVMVNSSSFDLVLGRGFGWFIDEFGIASHSIVIQSIVEGGLIFSLLFLLLMILSRSFATSKARIQFFAVLIPSMSVSLYVVCLAWGLSALYTHIIYSEKND